MSSASSVANAVFAHSLFQSSKHQSWGAVAFQHSIQELHINSGFHGTYTFLPAGKAALRLLGLGFKFCFSRSFTGAGARAVVLSSVLTPAWVPSPALVFLLPNPQYSPCLLFSRTFPLRKEVFPAPLAGGAGGAGTDGGLMSCCSHLELHQA